MFNEHDRKRQERIEKLLYKVLHEEENTDEWVEEIERLTAINETLVNELTQNNSQKVKQVLTQSFNNSNFIIMSLTLVSNEKAPIVLALIDADTQQPITATNADVSNTSDNLAAATVDGNNDLVGVAAGSGNLTSVATWTYTDAHTNQSVTKTLTTVTPFEISQTVLPQNVEQVVTLGTAVPQ